MSGPFQITPTNVFAPTQISGCSLWLDAADLRTFTLSASNIISWRDKSGLNNNGTTIGTIPLTSNINGIRTPRFTLNANTYFLGSNANTGTTLTAFSVYIQSDASTGNSRILSLGTQGLLDWNNISSVCAILMVNPNFVSYRNGATLSQITATYGVPSLAATVFTGSSNTFFLNGTAGTTVASSGNFNYSIYNIGTAIGEQATNTLSGTIGEVIVYPSALTTSQRQQVEGYLAWKWGLVANLPSNHPYKTTPLENILNFGAPSFTTPNAYTVPIPPALTNDPVFAPPFFTGCLLWLDANDPNGNGLVSAPGTVLTRWVDKSGSGNTVTANGSPIASNYNSRNAVYINSNWFARAGTYAVANTTIFFVFSMSTPIGDKSYFQMGANPNNGGGDTTTFFSDANVTRPGGVAAGRLYFGSGGTTFLTTQFPTATAADAIPYCIQTARITSSPFVENFRNGALQNSRSGTVTRVNHSGLIIGSSNGGWQWTGYMSEIIVYNSALSDANRQQVEGYLAWKWNLVSNLPNGHLYKMPQIAPFTYAIRSAAVVAPFNPTTITGCQLWLDGADTNTITGSSPITAWTDKSGTSRTVTFAGSSNTYNATTRSVNTNNANTSYFFANVDLRKSVIPYATVFLMHTWTGSSLSGTNQALWGQDIGGGWNRFQLLGFTATPSYAYGLSYTPNSPNVLTVSALNTANRTLYSAIYAYQITNGTFVNLNGSLSAGPVTEAVSPGQTTTTNTYFGTIDTGYAGTVAFHEIIIYTGQLTLIQRQTVEGYLAWKWGTQGSLPANHPFKLFPPK